jgi:nucleotide-binding universal stress UspA family protein
MEGTCHIRLDATQPIETCIEHALPRYRKGELSMTEINHILAAIDLSEAGFRVVAYAQHMADTWNASLTVLHVVHDLSYYSGVFITSTPLDTLQHNLEIEARDQLADICAEACGRDTTCETLVVTGRPVAEIQRLIRERAVDCLVIGSHSTDKPEHQLFGSTAERLLHQMLCPTLVIPPPRVVDFVSKG